MVVGQPSMTRVCPTTSGRRARWRTHSDWLMTAIAALPGQSSSAKWSGQLRGPRRRCPGSPPSPRPSAIRTVSPLARTVDTWRRARPNDSIAATLPLKALYSSRDVPNGSKNLRGGAYPDSTRSDAGSGNGRNSSAYAAADTAVAVPMPAARMATQGSDEERPGPEGPAHFAPEVSGTQTTSAQADARPQGCSGRPRASGCRTQPDGSATPWRRGANAGPTGDTLLRDRRARTPPIRSAVAGGAATGPVQAARGAES